MKLLLVIFFLLSSPLALAAEVAVVVKEKAILYSDMELTIPIGYIRKGKKIKIGKVARKRGTVLPTVASGRVVYIKSDDVQSVEQLASDNGTYITPKVTDHEVLIEEQKFEDDFSENNHVILLTGNMATGADWKTLADSEENSTISQVGISIEHRPELRKYSWAVGLHYLNSELEAFKFNSIMLEVRLQYSVLRFDWLALDLVAGINGSGDARLQNSQTGQEARGNLYGYSFGGQAKLFPFSQIGVIGGAEIRRYNVGNLGDIELSDGSVTQFKGFNGAQIWAGLTYKL